MRISEQNRADAVNMIKASKLWLLWSVSVAGVIAIWSPFYPKFFATVVALGILAGGITWFGWTRKTPRLFQSLRFIIPILGLAISKDFLVPDKLRLGSALLVGWQSFFVMSSAWMATILLGVVWFKKEVADIFTPAQPSNLSE